MNLQKKEKASIFDSDGSLKLSERESPHNFISRFWMESSGLGFGSSDGTNYDYELNYKLSQSLFLRMLGILLADLTAKREKEMNNLKKLGFDLRD